MASTRFSARLILEALEDRRLLTRSTSWTSFAHDPQHTSLSHGASQSIDRIAWQTPVDLNFKLSTHEGSPLVTAANTVIVPVRYNGAYSVEGRRASDGTLLWSVPTDYHTSFNSTVIFDPVLTPANRLYIAGAGGTVYYMDHPDQPGATISGQLAFYGIANHTSDLDATVNINTPLSVDRNGTIYFGFTAADNALGLRSGLARMDVNGNGNWIAASDAANDSSIAKVAQSCAPALSNDDSLAYVGVNDSSSRGYLVALNSTTLAPVNRVHLQDVHSGNQKVVWDQSSATPMVGPDGDVYYGIEEDPYSSNLYRGWMLHFSGDLEVTKTPGAFGWDTTASVVPRSMVPSYTGTSQYLIVTKYNKYAISLYQVGVLDPNAVMIDPYTGVPVMQDVLTVDAATSDREWCINDAVVDPATDSILMNSEDGKLYRWNLASNSLTQALTLDAGASEAYTPTLIGPDGTVYSINDGILFAARAQPSSQAPVTTDPVATVLPAAPLLVGVGCDARTPVTSLRSEPVRGDVTNDSVGRIGNPSHEPGTALPAALHQAVQDPFEILDLFG